MTLLQDPDLKIFLIAAAMVVALFALEVLFVLIGLGGGFAQADGDIDVDFDADAFDGDAMTEMTGVDLDDLDISDTDGSSTQAAEGAGGILGNVLDIIGFRKIPLTMWLTVACASFSALGLALQLTAHAIFDFTLPAELASALIVGPAASLTGKISRFIAWVIPSDETSAVSQSSLARRRGKITVGTAKRGSPAEVKIYDRFNNAHYLMLEPLSDEDEIAQGTDVVVVRQPGGVMRILPISE